MSARITLLSLLVAALPALPAAAAPVQAADGARAAAPAQVAQGRIPDWAPPSSDGRRIEDESDTTTDALDRLLGNLMQELRPALGQIGDGLDQLSGTMAPLLRDVARQIDDLKNYDPPERLANGDILIRRKADAPPVPEMGENLRDLSRPPEAPGQDPSAPDPGTRPNDAPDGEPVPGSSDAQIDL